MNLGVKMSCAMWIFYQKVFYTYKYNLQVHLNSEESEESQREEDEELLEDTIALCTYNFSKTVKRKMLNQSSNIFEEGQAEKLNNLTSSQLEAIIGGSLFE